jgi:hypothetical protein
MDLLIKFFLRTGDVRAARITNTDVPKIPTQFMQFVV